jgi:hypothetical protein
VDRNDEQPLSAAELAMASGRMHYFEDDLDGAREHFELAYRLFREAGEGCRAARAAIVLAELQSGSFGHPAVAQGWLARAHRLLDRVGPCVDWGWFEHRARRL